MERRVSCEISAAGFASVPGRTLLTPDIVRSIPPGDEHNVLAKKCSRTLCGRLLLAAIPVQPLHDAPPVLPYASWHRIEVAGSPAEATTFQVHRNVRPNTMCR